MDPVLERIADFLERQRTRATYGAVAHAAGVPIRSVGALLGDRCPRASWVVNQATGEPTGYVDHEKHVDLRSREEIIVSGEELVRRMKRG